MKERISILPRWVLTGTNPAFYDMDSKTCVEQTARVYAKVQEIVNDYNKFADEVEVKLKEFVDGSNKDNQAFKDEITKIVHDYIAMIDLKVKNNLSDAVRSQVDVMKESGEINEVVLNGFNSLDSRVTQIEKTEYKLVYDASGENLTLTKEVIE